ncbi:copper homeostasis membrane protein CopD [Bradyrhizobium sp. CCBAU 51745]|uniref:copper homeostasis membrane protein CopD n=1 Tax=Bradyrhizobium sp. CCBAU 51745 TaxID=1325099 RepID=UPI002306A275|nr:copper homeostasis membrane protein CopD [Bradyrhizobium sp. CCBAU 51745]
MKAQLPMDWSTSDAPLVAIRAVHLASTAMLAGNILFQVSVAGPASRELAGVAERARIRALRISWGCLAIAVISGGIWLALQAVSMSGMPLGEALNPDVLSTVVNETQFGRVAALRACTAVCLAICLICDRAAIARWLGLAASLAFAAMLAWTGHAGATFGIVGYLHLAADALHILAAAGWIGGLVPLILFLAAARYGSSPLLARDAVGRFSTMGIISVATLILTGVANTVVLVGSVRGLIATEYGQLLLVKLAVFAFMLTFAAVNRLSLTPRLGKYGDAARASLVRNSTIELVLGLVVFAIVGLLGTLHPAIHLAN